MGHFSVNFYEQSLQASRRSGTAYPRCWRFLSSRCLKKHERSCFHAQAWPGPRYEYSTVCELPPGCLEMFRIFESLVLCVCIQLQIQNFATVTHLFKANVCDVPQDTFHCICPFSLTQRILLSPNDIKIMWNMICCVILCLPLALTLKPGVDVRGRAGISCRFADPFLYYIQLS